MLEYRFARRFTELRTALRRGEKHGERGANDAHRSTNHLHNFQVSVFLYNPIPEQLDTLDDDCVGGCTLELALPGLNIEGGNTRRFTPTANVCSSNLERGQKEREYCEPRCTRQLSTCSSGIDPLWSYGHRCSFRRGGCRHRLQKALSKSPLIGYTYCGGDKTYFPNGGHRTWR